MVANDVVVDATLNNNNKILTLIWSILARAQIQCLPRAPEYLDTSL